MPKELIDNRYYGQSATDHSDCTHEPGENPKDGEVCRGRMVPLDDSAVKVGWTKDREHVEVAVLHHRDGDGAEFDAWHSQFDRQGLNRLIRVLKQARNDAFGKDE